MAKSPAFQFYPSDWLDKRVLRMSDAAQGVYLRLLCFMWKDSENQYSIEKNDKTIAKLLGLSSRKWKKLVGEIQWKGDPILLEKDGLLISKRLEKEKRKQLIKSKKASESANQRWMRTHHERITNASSSHSVRIPNASDLECTSTSTSTSVNKYVETSIEFRLSKLLFNEIRKRKPDFKKPNLQKWSVHVDKMIRLDKRRPKIIARVIRWVQTDVDFWQNNILSTEKLRKQFDQLELKMNKGSTGIPEVPAKPELPCIDCSKPSYGKIELDGESLDLCMACLKKRQGKGK